VVLNWWITTPRGIAKDVVGGGLLKFFYEIKISRK
jgi:hypothetical protein